MGQTTIEWVRNKDGSIGHTVNPIRATDKQTGAIGHFCEKISPGCANCYASRYQTRVHMHEFVPANRKKVKVWLDTTKLEDVLRRKVPTTYFWEDMSDLFGAWVKDVWLDACLATMYATPRHTHMILTKRADRMRMYFGALAAMNAFARSDRLWDALTFAKIDRVVAAFALNETKRIANTPTLTVWPPPHVRVGVSIENQATADERLPQLARTPAWDRYISYEPALGAVTLKWAFCTCADKPAAFGKAGHGPQCILSKRTISQIITRIIFGGESGPGARPAYIGWATSMIRQCDDLGVAPFVKQLGKFPTFTPIGTREFQESPIKPVRIPLKASKGNDPTEWPTTAPGKFGATQAIDLRRREWPD